MFRIICCFLLTVLIIGCGGDEDSGVLHFTKADVFDIILKDDAVDPTWSADGQKIVFVWQNDLWSVTPEGKEETQITTMSGQEVYPNWSPVAASPKIVFINNKGPEDYTIYTLTPGGGEPEAVETFTGQVLSTSFSRDGNYIIFLRYGKKAIYKIPVGGGDIVEITNSQNWGSVGFAQASPGRDVITYVEQDGSNFSIKTIDIAGGDPTEIISLAGSGQRPTSLAESYDASTLAFANQTDIWRRNIFSISLSGGEPVAITEFPSDSFHPNNPSWSSDGKRMVVQMPTGIYMVELK